MVSRRAKEPVWLENLRKNSSTKLHKIGYPTVKDEDWNYTNVEEILNVPLEASYFNLKPKPLQDNSDRDSLSKEFNFTFTSQKNDQQDELSYKLVSKAHTSQNLMIPMKEAILTDHKLLKDHLSITSFQEEKHSFFLENTSLFRDGLFLNVGAGVCVGRRVHLKFEMGGGVQPQKARNAYYIRNLIIVEEGASLELLEDYTSLDCASYLAQVVNEVILKPNASFKHTKVQRQSDSSYHLALNRVLQYRGSYYFNDLLMTGSNSARNEIQLRILDEDCTSLLNGIYIGKGEQSLDQNTYVEHTKPNAHSSQIYRGVLRGESNAAFQGEIYVHPNAQRTKAHQSNKTLLLSEKSKMHSRPQLRIFADDVECTHGVTMGDIDEEALFYLRSRGISEHEALNMLNFAFLEEALKGTSEEMHSYLGQIIKEELSSS